MYSSLRSFFYAKILTCPHCMQVYWNIMIFCCCRCCCCLCRSLHFHRWQCTRRVPSAIIHSTISPYTCGDSRNSYCLRLQLPTISHSFWCHIVLVRIDFKRRDGISAAANTFFSRPRRRRRHHVVVAFGRSNGNAVAATLNAKVMAGKRTARSICFAETLSFNQY